VGAITIRKAGLLTTVQDLGRWGHQHQGVSVSGPMDLFAHRAANILVGNLPGAAGLEITLTGPELVVNDTRVVAVAGASFEIAVDGRAVDARTPIELPAGAVLGFGRRVTGARAYLAIAGGIDVPPVLGSRATHVMTGMGGLAGRPLRPGDRLPLGAAASHTGRAVRPDALGSVPSDVVRVLPGPQDDRFAAGMLERLQSAPYLITQESDRTGYRLQGPALTHLAGADIISDATPHGSIQVPASGQPILLMADRQTTGGYPKIATVIAADLGVAGQLAPGDEVRFRVCSRQEALTALIARERVLLVGDRSGAGT
jgi:biotin-dependent carboxylase-like uncharacterized protein